MNSNQNQVNSTSQKDSAKDESKQPPIIYTSLPITQNQEDDTQAKVIVNDDSDKDENDTTLNSAEENIDDTILPLADIDSDTNYQDDFVAVPSDDSQTDDSTQPSATLTTPSGTEIQVHEISPGIFKATTDKSHYILEYDMNKCIGAASCSAIAPAVFFMNEENKAELMTDGEWDDDPIIMDAAMSCPVFAIKVISKETGEILFPEEEVY